MGKVAIGTILTIALPTLYDVFWFGTLFAWMIPRLSVGFVQILTSWTVWEYIATILFFTIGLVGAMLASIFLVIIIGAFVLGD